MTAAPMFPTPHYDSASHVDVAHSPRSLNEPGTFYLTRPKLPFNYAGLWSLLAGQNASADITFLVADLFEAQGLDGGVTGGWGLPPRVNRAFGIVAGSPIVQSQQPQLARRISLAEARRLAMTALLEAEERRQMERQREAIFWAALED